jgi:hypothetical protein
MLQYLLFCVRTCLFQENQALPLNQNKCQLKAKPAISSRSELSEVNYTETDSISPLAFYALFANITWISY